MNVSDNEFIELFESISEVDSVLPDHVRRDSLAKSTLIAYLILHYDLAYYLEFGSEIGNGFLAAAYASAKIKGKAYATRSPRGWDARSRASSNPILNQEQVSRIFADYSLPEDTACIQDGSEGEFFLQSKISFDLLHIKSGGEGHGGEQVGSMMSLVRDEGFIVFDNEVADWVKGEIKKLGEKSAAVFANEVFTVMRIGFEQKKFSVLEIGRLSILYSMLENKEGLLKPARAFDAEARASLPVISVIVISYNQEKYIAECLQGILAQKGDFRIELVIGDDASQDSTAEIIRSYIRNFGELVTVKIVSTAENVGMTRNFQRCLHACSGEFIAVCEGDDYWVDPLKLQKQMSFLMVHPDCSVCFSQIYMYFQNTGDFSVFEPDTKLVGKFFTTKDLVAEYFIGNLSCCMYDAKYMGQVRSDLFELFIGDWMFNIYYSLFGKIGYLENTMSVYRKHDNGVWGNEMPQKKARLLHSYIRTYNKFLNFEFDHEFSLAQKKLKYAIDNTLLDVAIIDDVAPHPLSAFRMQEFLSYMDVFESLMVYCYGISIHLLGKKTLDELLYDFSKEYPQHTSQIDILTPTTTVNAKLIYTVFLGNTYMSIDEIERTETPFVFCLYPGGMFGLNNEKSDAMLKRITSSPCFRKVIVTQKITYDYLIKKRYCAPEQIEFIFGVVTPHEQLEKEYTGKMHFGIDKETLDVCFIAHKYTEKGEDKGYDIFVAVAIALSEKYKNIRFHVVGGFDESVLDVSRLGDKIKFYGNREIEWFDDFHRDKDIILSPNIPFKIFEGSFDGFPTGSCTDAGLRETSIFCTDELKLNDGLFADGEELVIVPHDVGRIVETIEFYYFNPEKLAAIAKKGRRRIKELYSYEAQILPRINLLRRQVELFEYNKVEIGRKFDAIWPFRRRWSRLAKKIRRLSSKFFVIFRENTPPWLKNGIKHILPGFITRIYERFFV